MIETSINSGILDTFIFDITTFELLRLSETSKEAHKKRVFPISLHCENLIISTTKEVVVYPVFIPLLVCLVCEQDRTKSYRRIRLKFSGYAGLGPRRK